MWTFGIIVEVLKWTCNGSLVRNEPKSLELLIQIVVVLIFSEDHKTIFINLCYYLDGTFLIPYIMQWSFDLGRKDPGWYIDLNGIKSKTLLNCP